MASTTTVLGRSDVPSWKLEDGDAPTPDHEQRLAELHEGSNGPGFSAFYDSAARGIATAPNLNELQERHTALLGRERGVLTDRLAKLPTVPLEHRKYYGRSLNLIKRWLTEIHDARRDALAREAEARAGAGRD